MSKANTMLSIIGGKKVSKASRFLKTPLLYVNEASLNPQQGARMMVRKALEKLPGSKVYDVGSDEVEFKDNSLHFIVKVRAL